MCLNPRPFLLRPIHRPNVKRGILIEPFYPFARETDPFFRWDGRFQEELRCRVIHARTMELEIGRNPFECPSAIKHHGAEPGRMVVDGARAFEGVTPDLELHCARVNDSAAKLFLKPIVASETWVKLAHEGIARFDKDAALYIRPMYWAEKEGPWVQAHDPESTRW